jgi:hypothetical protein
MIINEEMRQALGLSIIGKRQGQLADGRKMMLPVDGPIEIRFEDRFCTTNALVVEDANKALLGAIPLEEMDLRIHPDGNMLTPLHPDGSVIILKGVR